MTYRWCKDLFCCLPTEQAFAMWHWQRLVGR